MSIVKISAMISGLLGLSTSHSWVVTQKLGNWAKLNKIHSPGLLGKLHASASLPVLAAVAPAKPLGKAPSK